MIDPDLRALFDALDATTKAAQAALAADDGEAWMAAASRGAEIHEELARRNGWRDHTPATPEEGNRHA